MKMSGSLPKGEANGLVSIARELVNHPWQVHAVVALVDCSKITTDIDSGDVVPTARVLRIEAVPLDELELAKTLLRRSLEHRTGQTVLPLGLEEELDEVFRLLDPETGEIKRSSRNGDSAPGQTAASTDDGTGEEDDE